MNGILADVNIEGHVDVLITVMKAEPWDYFWKALGLTYFHFSDIGLAPSAPDSLVWITCQARQLVLITDNRNDEDADSLQATIQSRNLECSLPVINISKIPRLRASADYRGQVINDLYDALSRIEQLKGTGRLFLPWHASVPRHSTD